MIFDLSESGERQLQCGVCVIGGGIAGLIAASRLSAAGLRVIVLESGGRKPLDRFDALNAVEQAGEKYRTEITGRVRALGGTSNIWGGRIMPLAPHDMAARDYVGLAGWPIERAELDRFIPDIERLFRLDHSAYEELPPSALHRRDPWSNGRAHMTPRWSKWPTFRRRNVAYLLEDMIAIDGNPEIWLNATACGLMVDGAPGRLAGVAARSMNGGRLTVFADWFVLAAGTFETTKLLLQLDELTEGRAFSGCGALGRYFSDHLKIEAGRILPVDRGRTNLAFGYHIGGSTRRGLHLETTAAAQREDGAASGYITVRPEFPRLSIYHYVRKLGKSMQGGRFGELAQAREVAKDLGSLAPALYWRVRHKQMYFSPAVDLFIDARIEQAPNLSSRLKLSGRRDELGAPMLHMEWRKSALDRRTLRSVLLRARRFWRLAGLDAASPVDWSADPDRDDLIDETVDTRHPAGTARMGLDPRTSVVNSRLACHAVPNIFVASAAVFPSTGSANPTLTIMQIACRAAESVIAAQ